MPVPTIYYLRHGETEWNALGRLQGTRDIPLNARGRGQAVQAGLILADLLKRDGKDKTALPYVSSPLGRARQTMELARGKLELPVADYALDDRLREIGYGAWEGLTLAESEAKIPTSTPGASPTNGRWGLRVRRPMPTCRSACVPGTTSFGPTPSRSPMAAPAGL